MENIAKSTDAIGLLKRKEYVLARIAELTLSRKKLVKKDAVYTKKYENLNTIGLNFQKKKPTSPKQAIDEPLEIDKQASSLKKRMMIIRYHHFCGELRNTIEKSAEISEQLRILTVAIAVYKKELADLNCTLEGMGKLHTLRNRNSYERALQMYETIKANSPSTAMRRLSMSNSRISTSAPVKLPTIRGPNNG